MTSVLLAVNRSPTALSFPQVFVVHFESAASSAKVSGYLCLNNYPWDRFCVVVGEVVLSELS